MGPSVTVGDATRELDFVEEAEDDETCERVMITSEMVSSADDAAVESWDWAVPDPVMLSPISIATAEETRRAKANILMTFSTTKSERRKEIPSSNSECFVQELKERNGKDFKVGG